MEAKDAKNTAKDKRVLTPADLAKCIDHTLLKPDARDEDIDALCAQAVKYGFYSVCVNSGRVARCARNLEGTEVKIASVVGFPLGAMDSQAKAAEARRAVELGADEIDMVMNIGALKSGDLESVRADIRAVTEVTGSSTICKVIIETVLLADDEKATACRIAEEAGANFVKTSTGFAGGGATIADVKLMRRSVGPAVRVKASGGVRSFKDAVAMIGAGADRLGTSSGVAIVEGAPAEGTGY
jgi:deoxyribose-phosphate aldolase